MTPPIPEPVAAFLARVNAHDEDGFLDAFTDDGVVDDWGRIFTGRAAIKQWSDKEFIGSNGTLTVEEADADGGRVTVVGDWRSTHANGRSKFVFDVDGDKLTRMTIREG
ncbi:MULTISPECIES: nuclear transport factor 2 family protein [unclassified Gordonia (in: high G+C Gram-positive bacteria)]|uniref:nuclear transport factor 2 family protein n=1 Tax=unclassified Gordonia (in: high G+C Gram-positive bacteria) TaxID=2657482 RepID=UPI001FFFD452|nr:MULTISPECIES: nuclear transport factor 2 family protein [unclassified Gordonia (in: high G+C Gram-positive bacteria)]UQE75179.1 nuclear transport factor 2 family protein [Gordonia sp. PP30]